MRRRGTPPPVDPGRKAADKDENPRHGTMPGVFRCRFVVGLPGPNGRACGRKRPTQGWPERGQNAGAGAKRRLRRGTHRLGRLHAEGVQPDAVVDGAHQTQQQRRDFTFVSTAVLAHSESSWTSSLSLNHGTDQDIAVGDCVVSAEGYLVGVISEVGLNWSTVLTVIDTDTELGARIFRTGEVAVAEGDFSLMGQGKLKLSYLTSDDEVLIGDQIVTSGLGGYYPSGLVIGSVESLQTGDDGLARYAVLTPMMDFNALTEVFVITDYDIVD